MTYRDIEPISDPGPCPDCGRGVAAHEIYARKKTEPPSFFCADEHYVVTSKASSAGWGWREAVHVRRLVGKSVPGSWLDRATEEAREKARKADPPPGLSDEEEERIAKVIKMEGRRS